MDPEPTNRGDPPADDPDAIRAAMAETRAALTNKLETLRERLLGPGPQAPNQGEQAMAKKKTATKKAVKKGAAVAKSAVKKKAAKAKPKAAAKKTAAPVSRKSAAKKTAVSKVKAKAPTKKAPAKKKKATSKIVQKVKQTIGEILVGAATGAMHGAAEVVITHTEDTARPAEQAAPAPAASSEPSPAETHTHSSM